MADDFTFEIVTPAGIILTEKVEEVYAPGQDGEFGVLNAHTELIGKLAPGVVCYKSAGTVKKLAIAGGYGEVLPDKVNLLVDTAIKGEDVDVAKANEEIAEAEKALEGIFEDDSEYDGYHATVDFAKAKLGAAS
jgi:F-type H+-transporting ATPase subunit epsilon